MVGRETDTRGCSTNHLHEQILSLALKHGVLLLVKHNDDVARRQPRLLVALAVERDALTILHALVNVHLQNLSLGHDLLSIARLALVLLLDHLTRALALVAVALDLLHHAGRKLAQLNLNKKHVTQKKIKKKTIN